MSYIKDLYLRLCMSAVFRSVLDKPLFVNFARYAKIDEKDEKIKAYAACVNEIYSNGGSLTELVFRLVSEDENVYIKSRAKGICVDDNVRAAVDAELEAFLFSLGCYGGEPITVISRRKSGVTVAIKDGRYSFDNPLAEAITVK